MSGTLLGAEHTVVTKEKRDDLVKLTLPRAESRKATCKHTDRTEENIWREFWAEKGLLESAMVDG